MDNNSMVKLDRKRLEELLKSNNVNLTQFAKECDISRQSIYNMFKGKSIFSTAFEKIIKRLNVDYNDLIISEESIEPILTDAPVKVQKALLHLQNYSDQLNADLFLFGSRARGKKGIRPDWDIAIYTPKKISGRRLALLKEEISNLAFPHRIDLVNLNSAPNWFLHSIADESIRITGSTNRNTIFKLTLEKTERSAA